MPASSTVENKTSVESDDGLFFDLTEFVRRLRRGLFVTLGLFFLGGAVGALVNLAVSSRRTAVTTMRVTFSFPGFERGLYPNGSKFMPDDLRAPDVITEAINRLGLPQSPDLASRIRGAMSITGFVSPTIIRERDRLRASGQTLPSYVPDEYEITLSLPRGTAPDIRQRELLLGEIVNVYVEKFRHSYVELPPNFGNAFDSLKKADFVEYELILTRETEALRAYLALQAEKSRQFRSSSTHFSFSDLLRQTEIFTQVRLNDVLGVIYINGLSRDRDYAIVKMDYYLRTLEDQEQRLREEESVVINLLNRTQERSQNYVLAVKDQARAAAEASRTPSAVVDQDLLDALLANDAYNFLVRRALDAGLSLKRVQSDKARLLERKRRMESFARGEAGDQAAAVATTQQALSELEVGYRELLSNISATLEDFGRQEYGDAIRVSMQSSTPSLFGSGIFGGAAGAAIGLALGLGLSLLRPAGIRPYD